MSAISTVEGIKESLSKMLPAEEVQEDRIETCQDMFKQLEDCKITLDILTKSLIGTVVSKFKTHPILGPQAKALVKSWKKVAKASVAKAAPSKKAATSERQDSKASQDLIEMKEQWGTLQPARQNSCQKLFQFLTLAKAGLLKDGINSDVIDHLAVERATEIESIMNKQLGNDRTAYANKARSLCFNIKKNTKMGGQILLGQLPADELVSMSSEQLASEDKRKEMAQRTAKLMDTKRLDWDQANESKINEMCGIKGDLLNASLFTCGRCKSVKTTSTQKQTRSADEPMTVFVFCLNCGKRWKC